jgi:hypothetical protein
MALMPRGIKKAAIANDLFVKKNVIREKVLI